jgi:pimeloyl-ACP methyl ester carboxylesterase
VTENPGFHLAVINWRELMAGQDFKQLYAGVPEAQKAQLLDFRESHPYKQINANRKTWRYFAAGRPGRMLSLTSADDSFSYPRLAILQERYPRAETHVFEAGGHHTYLFFPEAYTEVLERFLAGN